MRRIDMTESIALNHSYSDPDKENLNRVPQKKPGKHGRGIESIAGQTILTIVVLILVTEKTLFQTIYKRHRICSFRSSGCWPPDLAFDNTANTFLYYRFFCPGCQ